ILQAAATNETLSTVSLRFVHTTSTGVEETSQTITLTNATISEVRRYVDFTAAAGRCWAAGNGGRVISVPGQSDADADSLRQPVDFYSPDTFNYVTLEISADGKSLPVDTWGIDSYPPPTAFRSRAKSLRRILGFRIDAQ